MEKPVQVRGIRNIQIINLGNQKKQYRHVDFNQGRSICSRKGLIGRTTSVLQWDFGSGIFGPLRHRRWQIHRLRERLVPLEEKLIINKDGDDSFHRKDLWGQVKKHKRNIIKYWRLGPYTPRQDEQQPALLRLAIKLTIQCKIQSNKTSHNHIINRI